MADLYRVRIRRSLAKVRPEAEHLDGRCFHFYPGWVMTDEDTSIYVGETAMLFADPRELAGLDDAPAWIASGDLEPADGVGADGKRRDARGHVLHGCETCDGEDECTCGVDLPDGAQR